MTREVILLVNDTPIPLDGFVQGFIDHTVGGMLAALKGTGEIDTVEVNIDGKNVAINLNNAPLPLNYFASDIIRNTVEGMVSSLKGVSEIRRLKISITR